MAPLRSKTTVSVGSAPWISTERSTALQFVHQEVEEFTFSARNEMDWLNEHMADIFSKTQKSITEIFKTPGKLRGKTPRTICKRNAPETRAPLTDIFAPNQQTPDTAASGTQSRKEVVHFKISEDLSKSAQNKLEKKNRIHQAGKENTDSGYHGSEGAADILSDANEPLAPSVASQNTIVIGRSQKTIPIDSPQGIIVPEKAPVNKAPSEQVQEIVDIEQVSHKEAEPSADWLRPQEPGVDGGRAAPVSSKNHHAITNTEAIHQTSPARALTAAPEAKSDQSRSDSSNPSPLVNSRSPSDRSSPVQPAVRKSSLSFASLPAREPLGSKISIGGNTNRNSHLEQSVLRGGGHATVLGALPPLHADTNAGLAELPNHRKPELANDSDNDLTITQLHRKTSTQRLHERISQLGQSQQSRPTKSISSILQQPPFSDLAGSPEAAKFEPNLIRSSQPNSAFQRGAAQDEEDDDEWIPSQKPAAHPVKGRPQLVKSYSADVMEDISGKDSIGAVELGAALPMARLEVQPSSEVGYPELQAVKRTGLLHRRSASMSTPASPQLVVAAPTMPVSQTSVVPETGSPSRQNYRDIEHGTSTYLGSKPTKSINDGPLSASKAKLSSILKSARGIFASSAGVSAQAKMETLSPSTMTLRSHAGTPIANTTSGHFQSPTDQAAPIVRNTKQKVMVSSNLANVKTIEPSRKLRKSLEIDQEGKGKEPKERQDTADQVKRAMLRDCEQVAVPEQHGDGVAGPSTWQKENFDAEQPKLEKSPRRSQRKRKTTDEDLAMGTETVHALKVLVTENGYPEFGASESSGIRPQPATQSTKAIRRPVRPGKVAGSNAKPVPVSIKVGTASQRELDHRKVNPPNTTLANSLQQSLAPSAASSLKQPGLQTKPASTALRKAPSNASLKTSVSAQPAKPKALAAAARKKELDEREAQRKLELKREMERKKLALQEEERKREQQRREQELQHQREQAALVDDPKKIAQKQAIEKRRLELAKKQEQQRNAMTQSRTGKGNDLASVMEQEKAQTQMAPGRGELSNARPVSRVNSTVNLPGPLEELGRGVIQPQFNPARPPKRAAPVESTDERFNGPSSKVAPSYMQVDSKRRKTNNEEDEVTESRQAMPPPMRQSTLRKDVQNKSFFSQGYSVNNPLSQQGSHAQGTGVAHVGSSSAALSSSSLFKSTTMAQHHLQHAQTWKGGTAGGPDMARFANAKIPFADSNHGNYAVGSSRAGQQQQATTSSTQAARSSPAYQDPEAINLPEIPTDSEEDEDDDEEEDRDKNFQVPDWAQSPALRALLNAQQMMDPEEVFGPMAPLQMEEIFKNNNNGNSHKRFRSRTSSANWSGQDRLTIEEIQRDREARRKLILEGEWRFTTS